MSRTIRFRPQSWSPPNIESISATGSGTSSDSGAVVLTENLSGTLVGTSSDSGTPQAAGGIGTFRENEPSGVSAWKENDMDPIDQSGWLVYEDIADTVTQVADATAPHSPDQTLELFFPQGTGSTDVGGLAAGDSSAQSFTEVYWDFYMKLSPDWEMHDAGNFKVFFLRTAEGGGSDPLVLRLGGSSSFAAMHLNVLLQSTEVPNRTLTQNVNTPEFTRDVWHHVELHAVLNTAGGTADGELHIWQDGSKCHEYMDIEWWAGISDREWTSMKWEIYWGGQGDTVDADMWGRLDHWYISGV